MISWDRIVCFFRGHDWPGHWQVSTVRGRFKWCRRCNKKKSDSRYTSATAS